MADELDALLGLGIKEEDDVRALAEQLRKGNRTDDYFALSSTEDVRDDARRSRLRRFNTAKHVGTRRFNQAKEDTRITEQAVTDTRNKRTDQRLDDRLGLSQALQKHNLNKMGKAEYFTDADGNQVAKQQMADGTYVPVEELEGLKEYDKYNNRTLNLGADKKDNYGNAYYRDADGNRYFIDDVPWSEDEAYNRGRRLADLAVDEKGEKQNRVEQAKTVNEFMTDSFKASGSNRRIAQQYRSAISLLEQGAGTGSVEERVFTFKDVTKALESLQADIGLERIGPLKLTPVSDVDLANVFKTSIPLGLDTPALKQWLNFKIESFGILAEIQDYTYSQLEANNGKMPTGEQKTEMDAHIRTLMNSGEYGLVMPDLAAGGAPGEATRPDYVTEAEWATFTPEQRDQL